MITLGVSVLAVASASANIFADVTGRRRWVYLLKPLTMVWLVLVAAPPPWASPSAYRACIVAGLLCSLAGDAFLMLPKDRFLWGLGAFLVAHVLYAMAFTLDNATWGLWWGALPFVAAFISMSVVLWSHTRGLRAPVMAYELVILVMAWRAWLRWEALGQPQALWAALGATLFMISDICLALERFVRRFRAAQAAVLGTYFCAQWLIALSV